MVGCRRDPKATDGELVHGIPTFLLARAMREVKAFTPSARQQQCMGAIYFSRDSRLNKLFAITAMSAKPLRILPLNPEHTSQSKNSLL
jgi:hypothetical protein